MQRGSWLLPTLRRRRKGLRGPGDGLEGNEMLYSLLSGLRLEGRE